MPAEVFIANWKKQGHPYKHVPQWVEQMRKKENSFSGKKIIVAPPDFDIVTLKREINSANLSNKIDVALQDIEIPNLEGLNHTGATPLDVLPEFASYAILGHSETRIDKKLSDEDVARRAELSQQLGLIPIVCFSNIKQVKAFERKLRGFQGLTAYEPSGSIDSGKPATPDDAASMAYQIKQILGKDVPVLYGGSVDAENVGSFLQKLAISGVIIGRRSIEANSFFIPLIENGIKSS